MNTLDFLNNIEDVCRNSRVNIVVRFNEGYTLLVEGSFRVKEDDKVIFSSNDYVNSDYNSNLLEKLRHILRNKKVENALLDNDSGELVLVLLDKVTLEVYYDNEIFSSWELCKDAKAIYSSQGGGIVSYGGVGA